MLSRRPGRPGDRIRAFSGIALVALLGLIGVGLAAAQQTFRITFHRARDETSSIVLVGEVVNDGPRDVVDVWVTAQAENAGNQIVGRGMAYVTSFLLGRGTTAFVVKLPRVEDARSFQLVVSSFRYASAGQSP
jgi:hypothetical protein